MESIGDVTPGNSKDALYLFSLIFVGLSLVSMTINVIQIKLERLFEKLMMEMMMQYSEGQLQGDELPPPPVSFEIVVIL